MKSVESGKLSRLIIGSLSLEKLKIRYSFLPIIILLALFFRIYKFSGVGLTTLEIANIERILAFSDISNFLNENVTSNLYYFLQFLVGRGFGFSIINMRITSIVISIIGLLAFHGFVREWFSKRAAYISTFLLSISFYYLMLSRNVSHEIFYFFLITFSLYFLTLAYRKKKKIYFAISGILIGLNFYASEITISLALIFIASAIYFYYKNKKFITSYIREVMIALITFLMTLLPFLAAVAKRPGILVSQFTNSFSVVYENLNNLVASILVTSPKDYMYNVSDLPIFDPYILLTFITGLIYIILKMKRRKYYFLIVWTVVALTVILIRKDFNLGNIVYLLPLIFIMSAIIQGYVLSKWFTTFPFNRWARIVMTLGIGFFFAMSLTYNFEKYFFAWQMFPERKLVYNVTPLSQQIETPIYLYQISLSRDVAQIILNKDNIEVVKLENTEELKNIPKPVILTSRLGANQIRKVGGLEEYRGLDLVLFKGSAQ